MRRTEKEVGSITERGLGLRMKIEKRRRRRENLDVVESGD